MEEESKIKQMWNMLPLKYKFIVIGIGSGLIFTIIFIVILITPLMELGIIDIEGISSSISGGIGNIPPGSIVSGGCDKITVLRAKPDGTTYEEEWDFEEYIAGVVSAELSKYHSIEVHKAQAVLARNIAITKTNYCQNSIKTRESGHSSKGPQAFNGTIHDYGREAAEATKGQVLTYNSKVFSAMYSRYASDSECDCTNYVCNATYYKNPNNESYTLTLTGEHAKAACDWTGGHSYGMSQLAADMYAEQGWTYDKILAYFYSDGVEISYLAGNGFTSVANNTSYWWPIGSLDTSTIGNVIFASGEPLTTTVTSSFGSDEEFRASSHKGLDIGNAGNGPGVINVISAKDGKVVYPTSSNQTSYNDNGSLKNNDGGGYGNYVMIEHSDGTVTLYAHLAKDSITVMSGDTVKQGQVIAKMGHSGRSTGTHLHFEVRVNGTKVNPLNYVNTNNTRPITTS